MSHYSEMFAKFNDKVQKLKKNFLREIFFGELRVSSLIHRFYWASNLKVI